jgi:DNA-binding CsgD family transcriptional regulator
VSWRDVDLAELDLGTLTDQQRACVALAAAGLSQRDAATYLGLSRSTYRTHLEAAAHRLGLTGAT